LERELGRQPRLPDLLRHFSHGELDIIWDDLTWLYGSDFDKVEELQVIV